MLFKPFSFLYQNRRCFYFKAKSLEIDFLNTNTNNAVIVTMIMGMTF